MTDYTEDEMNRYREQTDWHIGLPDDVVAKTTTFAWWLVGDRCRELIRAIDERATGRAIGRSSNRRETETLSQKESQEMYREWVIRALWLIVGVVLWGVVIAMVLLMIMGVAVTS